MTTSASKVQPTRIALFSAATQGFYFGEIVNQIRSLCFIKGYQLTIVNTVGQGTFDMQLGIERIDAAIIIKNSVSNQLAQTLSEALKIPSVSIGYDYFPIKIPVISSNHEMGVKLAIDHLLKSGCQDIAFIGDLSQYDIRKRYEAYCDIHETLKLPIKDEHLFNIDNAVITGGNKAAEDFINNGCTARGILAGAGLTGVGFYQTLAKRSKAVASNLHYVCFDTLSLIPVFTPKFHAVDPNIHLIAYKCLNKIEAQFNHQEVEGLIQVEPKLISINDDPQSSYDEFLATCVDLPEIHNPNYMKAIITNIHEWPQEIVESNLDKIMSISPLFEKFMGVCALSKFHTDNKNQQWVKILKIFTQEGVTTFGKQDKSTCYRAQHFDADSIIEHTPYFKSDNCCHFTLYAKGKPWGFITTLGNTASQTPASSFLAFSGYMASISDLYIAKVSTSGIPVTEDKQQSIQTQQIDPDAIIHWDYKNSVTTWSTHALSLLGYESKIEINIYQHMDLTDRIHCDHIKSVRNQLSQLVENNTEFNTTAEIKLKTGKFAHLIIHGQLDTQATPAIAVFTIGVAPVVDENAL